MSSQIKIVSIGARGMPFRWYLNVSISDFTHMFHKSLIGLSSTSFSSTMLHQHALISVGTMPFVDEGIKKVSKGKKDKIIGTCKFTYVRTWLPDCPAKILIKLILPLWLRNWTGITRLCLMNLRSRRRLGTVERLWKGIQQFNNSIQGHLWFYSEIYSE